MKKITWLIILLVMTTLFVWSCKKKDKVNTCAVNEANFAGSYKVESAKYKASASSAETDALSTYFDPCELDDVTTFNTNHTYTYTDAGTTCTPNGNDNGTWSLSGSNLIVDGFTQVVENFSCNNFSISNTDVNTAGDKLTITFKKQ